MSSIGAELAVGYVTVVTRMPGAQNQIAAALGSPAVKKTVQRQGSTLGATLSTAMSKGYAGAKSFIPDLISGFKDARAAASSFTGFGANIGVAIRKGLTPAITTTQNLIAGFNDSRAAASTFTGFAGSIGGVLRRGLEPGITSVQNFIAGFNDSTAAGSALTGFMGTAGGAIRRGLDPAIKWTQDFISGFNSAEAAASSFTGRAGELGGMASAAWGRVSQAAGVVAEKASKAWSTIRETASTAFDGVKNAAISLTDQLGGMFDKVAFGAGALFAAFAGTAGKKGFDRLVTIEDATAALSITMGDAASAGELLDDVMEVVSGTGYNFDSFAAAASTLAGFNVAGEKIPGYLTAIGEAAATKGKQANEFAERLTTQFGQMAAVGQVSMSDIWSLANVGVDGLTILGNHFGVATDEMKDMISSGAVPAGEAMDVLSEGILNGSEGIAGSTVALEGTMEALRDTTSGVLGGMWSAISRFGASALSEVMPVIKQLAQGFTEWLDVAGPKVGEFFENTIGFVSRNKDWIMPLVVGLSSFAGVIGTIIGITKIWTAVQTALNLVMSLNPIGAIIAAIAALVAGLVYFFTQTETGKAIWAGFVGFLQEAWANISSFFVSAWENYIKPVFDGIAAVAVWVWETILQPIFNAFAIGFAILGGILAGIWNSIIKPAFSALGQIVSWLWVTIVQPVFKAIGAIFKWIWNTIARPVIAAIQVGIKALGAVFAWLWANAIKPNIDRAGAIFKWLKEKVIDPIWNGIKTTISNVWNNGIKPVIDRLVKIVKDDPKKAFEAARDGITKAWNAIQDAAKKPVKFVINTVVNGLIGTINKIPGVNIPKVKLPAGFYDGGYTGALPATRVAGVVHGDEHVIRSQSRRRIEARHPGLLDHMNRTGTVPGFRRGGYVNPLPRGSYSISQPFHSRHNGIDMAAPTGTKIMAAQDGRVVHAGWWPYGGGNQVNMVHPDGVHTWYAHMSRIQTRVGAEMKRGQVIGRVGSTGNSTGPHLHYMVMPGGYPNYINPAPYLSGFATPSGDGWNPLSGLVDWVADKIKTKFPSAGMWVDAAAGVAKSMAEKAIEAFTPSWGTDDTGSTRATLFDRGGWLDPGMHLVENRTGRPEPILTGAQWSALLESRTGSDGPSEFNLYDIDGELIGRMRGEARRVTGSALSRGSQRSVRSELGVS